MVVYSCKRCGWMTNIRTHFTNHLNRKNTCKPIVSDCSIETLKLELLPLNSKIYGLVSTNVSNVSTNTKSVSTNVSTNINSCQYCGKNFKHRQSKYNHEKKFCKEISKKSPCSNLEIVKPNIKEDTSNLLDIIKELCKDKEKMRKQHEEQIEKLIEKVGDTTNNIENQHINIHINNYGNENLDYLTPEYLQTLLNIPYGAIPKLIKHIYFNPDHPENHNIKITNKKLPYAIIFDKEKWVYKDRKEVITGIVDKSYNIIDEHYEDGKNNLEDIVSTKFKFFQEKYDNDNKDLKKQLSKECELAIINEK